MKKITIVFLIFAFGCTKDDDVVINDNKEFLVSKVFDYQNRLLADYIYNDSNQLTKRIFTDPATGNSSDLLFHYSNNKVIRIEYIDYDAPQFNYNEYLHYNNIGKIVRLEKHQNENILNQINFEYYPNGQLKYLLAENSQPLSLYEYDNNRNVAKVTHYFTDSNTGESYEQIRTFVYDGNKKPSFNLNYLIQISLLPKMGNSNAWERNVSFNNMTFSQDSGTKWSYEYNENGFPITILTEWDGVTTQEPMLLRIEYRER